MLPTPVKVGLSESVGCPSTHSYGLDHERDYARVVWFHHELHFDWHFQEITIKKERKEEKEENKPSPSAYRDDPAHSLPTDPRSDVSFPDLQQN